MRNRGGTTTAPGTSVAATDSGVIMKPDGTTEYVGRNKTIDPSGRVIDVNPTGIGEVRRPALSSTGETGPAGSTGAAQAERSGGEPTRTPGANTPLDTALDKATAPPGPDVRARLEPPAPDVKVSPYVSDETIRSSILQNKLLPGVTKEMVDEWLAKHNMPPSGIKFGGPRSPATATEAKGLSKGISGGLRFLRP